MIYIGGKSYSASAFRTLSLHIIKKMNYHSWSTSIDKLMLWRTSSWTKFDSKMSNLLLRVHYDQLLIISDSKILESFNMHYKMKGIFKDDILILIVSNTQHNQEIRKLKFQFKHNAAQYLEKLGKHFPVISHSSVQSNLNSKFRNIDDVLKYALEKKDNAASLNFPLAFNNFVKLCLLDPTFPQFVLETEKILANIK